MSSSTLDRALSSYSHLNLTHDVAEDNRVQIGGGGYSDVFRAQMNSDWKVRSDNIIEELLVETRNSPGSPSDRVEVAVKRIRLWGKGNSTIDKEVAKELKIWAKLLHPNVLPLLGFVLDWSAYPSFVSPWMETGTLRHYMSNHDIETLPMTRGIASGLQYLHSQGVVHADLKCENVLLSPILRPLLTDFGLSRQTIASVTGKPTTTKDVAGSLRWMAAEFFRRDQPVKKANNETDVWAFGMTILEMLTRDIPYGHIRSNDYQIMWNLAECNPPPQPDDMNQRPKADQELWLLCQECWKREGSERPTVTELEERLDKIEPPLEEHATNVSSTEDHVQVSLSIEREESETATLAVGVGSLVLNVEKNKTLPEESILLKIQEKLKETGISCLAGFDWRRVEGGYCCPGGGHFMRDEELGIVEDDVTAKPSTLHEGTQNQESSGDVRGLTEDQIQHEIQERLKVTGLCTVGYAWQKEEGGYRCTGGSHFMTNEELGIPEEKPEDHAHQLATKEDTNDAGFDAGRTEDVIQQEIQERLKVTGLCTAGYAWQKEEGGYRCAGGGHFMSNKELGIFDEKAEDHTIQLLTQEDTNIASRSAKTMAEEKIQQRIQEKLKETGECPQGYHWQKVQGGYRCAGGGHFMSDEELGVI